MEPEPKRRKLDPEQVAILFTLFDLPIDVLRSILIELSIDEIFSLCHTNKRALLLCDDKFWTTIIKADLTEVLNYILLYNSKLFSEWRFGPHDFSNVGKIIQEMFAGEFTKFKSMSTQQKFAFYNDILRNVYGFYPYLLSYPVYGIKNKVLNLGLDDFYNYVVLLANDRYDNVRYGEKDYRLPGVADLRRDDYPYIFGNPVRWGQSDVKEFVEFETLFPGGTARAEKDTTTGIDSSVWKTNKIYTFDTKGAFLENFQEDEFRGAELFEDISPPVGSSLVRMPRAWWIGTEYRILLFHGSVLSSQIPSRYLLDLKFSYTPSTMIEWFPLIWEPETLDKSFEWGHPFGARDTIEIYGKEKGLIVRLYVTLYFNLKFTGGKMPDRLFNLHGDYSYQDGPYIHIDRVDIFDTRVFKKNYLFAADIETRKRELGIETDATTELQINEILNQTKTLILNDSIHLEDRSSILTHNGKAILFDKTRNMPLKCNHIHNYKELKTWLQKEKDPNHPTLCPRCYI